MSYTARSSKRIYFDEEEIKLAAKIYKALKNVSEWISYLRSKEDNLSSLIILENRNEGFEELLRETKRKTDLVVTIDKEEGLYIIICQKTNASNSQKFIKRVFDLGKRELLNNSDPYAAILCNEGNKYETRDILFMIVSEFLFFSKQDPRFRINGIISETV